jgi:hypothetical protein
MNKIIDFITNVDYDKYINELITDGVSVFPVLTKNELKCYHDHFYKEIKKFPEYLPTAKIYVQGGFGALGNPGSFHNTTVRTLRMRLMFSIIPLLSKYPKINKIEQLIDRMSIRRVGTSLSKESWHRDISKDTIKGDIIFGGWINLDLNNEQKFSCVKGTQITDESEIKDKKGFAKISTTEGTKLNKQKSVIKIPPGHQIIFYQNIIHEVLSVKQTQESIRLYSGWRLTTNSNPLIKDFIERIKNQAIIPLPSSQLPPLYSASHINFHRDATIKWSKETFLPKLIEHKKGKSKNNIIEYDIIPRYMKSLKELKLPNYLKYSKYELSIYKPNNQWTLLLYTRAFQLSIKEN